MRRRYYEGYFNPYNRHDTGIYTVYRQSDDKWIGSVVDCHSEGEAQRKAEAVYGCKVYVSLVEE